MIHLTQIKRKYRDSLKDKKRETTERLKSELIEEELSRTPPDRHRERLRARANWWALT